MTQTISTIVDHNKQVCSAAVYMTQTISTIVDFLINHYNIYIVYMTQTISTIVDRNSDKDTLSLSI